ncbi:MAG: YslB family protein [Carnobacterium sp.]|uniref:YslB family protein n=1 Tax=Carnobacterium sp. TaxID=48221 RepID=UPI002FCA4306
MKDQKTTIDLNELHGTVPLFGYALIRDALIPNLLGKETNEMLYWAGKELARQYPLSSFQDNVLFFEKTGFGTLSLMNQRKNTTLYSLSGAIVTERLTAVSQPSFNLEAGFLAEQVQQQEGLYTEAIYEVNVKKKEVIITLQWDTKDRVSIAESIQPFLISEAENEPAEMVDSVLAGVADSNEKKESTLEKMDKEFAEPIAEAIDETLEELLDENGESDSHPAEDTEFTAEEPSVFEHFPTRSSKHKKI